MGFLEAGDLDVEYCSGYGWLHQKECQKSMLQLDLYQQMQDKYEVLYLNQEDLEFSFSKKLRIKFLYDVDVRRNKMKTAAQLSDEISESTKVWIAFQEEKGRFIEEREKRLDEFREKADSFERWRNCSFWTDKERYMMGRMNIEEYFNADIIRSYYEGDVAEKIDKQIAKKRYEAERIQEISKQEAIRNRKYYVEENESIRFMKVAELAYSEGKLVAIVAYKEEQAVMEVQCQEAIDLDVMEGKVYDMKMLYHEEPDLKRIITYIMK